MANANRQTERRKAKRRRRRLEVKRILAKWEAETTAAPQGEPASDLARKSRTLRRTMRVHA